MKALAKFLALFVTSLVLFGGSVHSDHSFFSDGGSHHRPFSSYQLAETTTATPYYRPTNTYHQPKKPTQQNCTVEDEVLEAEICTPDVRISCQEEQLMSSVVEEEEECFQVQTLECSRSEEDVHTNVCSYVYESKETPTDVTVIEIEFEKKCTTNMVTVCQPQGYGHHSGYHQEHHYGPKCEEIEQKSCYNQPKAVEAVKTLVLVLPEPKKKCTPKTLKVPKVSCHTQTENVCIKVPKITQKPVTVKKCVPKIAGEKCDHIELVLPKQICKDLIVGDAHPVPKYPQHHYSN